MHATDTAWTETRDAVPALRADFAADNRIGTEGQGLRSILIGLNQLAPMPTHLILISRCGTATLLEPPRGAGRAGPPLGALSCVAAHMLVLPRSF